MRCSPVPAPLRRRSSLPRRASAKLDQSSFPASCRSPARARHSDQTAAWRTQPHTELQGKEFGRLALAMGAKNFYVMMPQTPFTETVFKAIRETVEPKGVKVNTMIFDNKKTSFRSEVDEMMRANPDLLMMGGYQAENIVMAKDLFRANFKGKIMGFAFGITPAFIEAAGKEAAEGMYGVAEPSPARGSAAYGRLKALVKRDTLDTYICQAYDHA